MHVIKSIFTNLVFLTIMLFFSLPGASAAAPLNSCNKHGHYVNGPSIYVVQLESFYKFAQNNEYTRKRENLIRRWQRWKSLPPDQKELLRRRYRQWKRLPPKKRKKLLSIYRTLKRMPPEERRELIPLIRRWHSLTPEERGYVLKKLREYGFDNSPRSI